MFKFLCNKLSRDKTAERLKSFNIKVDYKIIEGKELVEALNKKLLEEAQEVVDAENKEELTAELADLLEVIDVFCSAHNIDMQQILEAKQNKKEQRGSFGKGIFIDTIEMEEDNEWASYFSKRPEKYPKV